MNGNAPFDPQEDAPLLSAYVDGELGPQDAARVESHLAGDPRARRLVADLRRLKSLTGAMRLKDAPPESWEAFWDNLYNRTERSVGWVLLAVGAALVGGWGAYALTVRIWDTAALPPAVKVGVLGVGAGLLVLLVSAVRERFFTRNRTRYKDVVR